MLQAQALTLFSATYDIQAGRKDKKLSAGSRQGHRALCLQNSVHSDSWSHYVLHGQKVLIHPRTSCRM